MRRAVLAQNDAWKARTYMSWFARLVLESGSFKLEMSKTHLSGEAQLQQSYQIVKVAASFPGEEKYH